MDEQQWQFNFRVVAKGGGKGEVGKGGGSGEEGERRAQLRATTKRELERLLAAGAEACCWRSEVRRLRAKLIMVRWRLVQESRRRRLAEEEQEGAEARAVAAEERAAEEEERAARWKEKANRYREGAKYWAGAHWEGIGKRRAAEEEVAGLRAAAAAALAAAGPIPID